MIDGLNDGSLNDHGGSSDSAAEAFVAPSAIEGDETYEGDDEAADGIRESSANECFDGDTGDLPPAARYACTELLRKYYVSAATEGALYQTAVDNLADITRCLNNLYLRVHVSKRYQVVYATSVPDEDLVSGVQRMSVKRNVALKRDETVLLVRLRVLQHKLEAEDDQNWFVERREMEDHLRATCYRDDLDEERVNQRISNAIKTLCTLGYLKLASEEEQRYRIMPILPATLDLERVHALAGQLDAKADGAAQRNRRVEAPVKDRAGQADSAEAPLSHAMEESEDDHGA